ncbi:MAG: iron-containing alcohol dehydrogenase [Geminicoccaceae bacterium]
MVRSQAISIDDRGQVTRDPISELLSGTFRLPETGDRVHCPVQSLIIEPSLDGRERDLLGALDFPSSPTIVCDPNTYDALAKRIAAAIQGAKVVVMEAPKADLVTVEQLIDRTRHDQALVAVGAGTLNDLVKYVSHRRRKPYVTFATAPSMNGYVTATASVSQNGEKLSLPATPPQGAFFDLTVLANAPQRLIRAGVGDSLCRSTSEIDWLLSHHLFDTVYLETPFTIQAQDEAALLARIGDLEKAEPEAFMALARLLVLGGLGMLIVGSSQPGSQGEHLISHYIDMNYCPHPGSLHGEQVGLATRTMATLQHHVLTRNDPPVLTETTIDPAVLIERFGSRSASCRAAMVAKALTGDQLEALNQRLVERWSALRAAFKSKALSLEQLNTAFDAVGMAADPEDLGIDHLFYREAVLHARALRDRFTILDLAADAGILTPFIAWHLGDVPK